MEDAADNLLRTLRATTDALIRLCEEIRCTETYFSMLIVRLEEERRNEAGTRSSRGGDQAAG